MVAETASSCVRSVISAPTGTTPASASPTRYLPPPHLSHLFKCFRSLGKHRARQSSHVPYSSIYSCITHLADLCEMDRGRFFRGFCFLIRRLAD